MADHLTNKKTGVTPTSPRCSSKAAVTLAKSAALKPRCTYQSLLTNYGKDPVISKLIDTKTFYAKPHNNPDGSSVYHYTAQTLRSTVRPDDNDNDGLFDEDSAEDLDGDGFIRQMRKYVGPGKGNANVDKADPKGRLMQNVGAGQGDYLMLGSEGYDNDGDGRVNEDGIGAWTSTATIPRTGGR